MSNKGKKKFNKKLVLFAGIILILLLLIIVVFDIQFVIESIGVGSGFIIFIWLLLFIFEIPFIVGIILLLVLIISKLRSN